MIEWALKGLPVSEIRSDSIGRNDASEQGNAHDVKIHNVMIMIRYMIAMYAHTNNSSICKRWSVTNLDEYEHKTMTTVNCWQPTRHHTFSSQHHGVYPGYTHGDARAQRCIPQEEECDSGDNAYRSTMRINQASIGIGWQWWHSVESNGNNGWGSESTSIPQAMPPLTLYPVLYWP